MESLREAANRNRLGIVPVPRPLVVGAHCTNFSYNLRESGKTETVWKVPRRVLFKADQADLEEDTSWSAECLSHPRIRHLAVRLGLPPRPSSAIFRNVLSPEPSSARPDAPTRRKESRGLPFKNCSARLQHRRRGLLNPLDHSFGTNELECRRVRNGYFKGCIEFCQTGRLRSQRLRIGWLLNF
jgi:hypothetical protein